MVELIATTTWRNRQFEGHVRRGTRFFAGARRARDLIRLGRAIPCPAPPPPAVPRQVTARSRPIRLALMIPVWQRHRLTRLVLSHYAALRERLADDGLLLSLFVVGSEGALSRSLADPVGAHYVEAPNHPLSMKFQAGVTALRAHDCDAVVILGSDDLLNAHCFDEIGRALDAGREIVDFRELYVFDAARDRLVFFPRIYIGCGRVFARSVLDRLDWRLWKTAVNKGVDMTLDRDLNLGDQIHAMRGVGKRGAVLVDVKTAGNLWSLADLLRLNPTAREEGPVYVEPDVFFESYFPGIDPCSFV